MTILSTVSVKSCTGSATLTKTTSGRGRIEAGAAHAKSIATVGAGSAQANARAITVVTVTASGGGGVEAGPSRTYRRAFAPTPCRTVCIEPRSAHARAKAIHGGARVKALLARAGTPHAICRRLGDDTRTAAVLRHGIVHAAADDAGRTHLLNRAAIDHDR